MWGMNRYARPPWSTGLFVALACIIAAVGGWVSWREGKRIKKVEGVAPKEVVGDEEKGVIGAEGMALRDMGGAGTGREEYVKTSGAV